MRLGQFHTGDTCADGGSNENIAGGVAAQAHARGGNQGRAQIPQGGLMGMQAAFQRGDGKGRRGVAAGESVVSVRVGPLFAGQIFEALGERDADQKRIGDPQGMAGAVAAIGQQGQTDPCCQVQNVAAAGSKLGGFAVRRVGLSGGG